MQRAQPLRAPPSERVARIGRPDLGASMPLLADYPFLDVLWTMLVFFLWVAWFWILFGVWGDIFRRHELSGGGKTGWFIFTLVLPFLGVFIYGVSQNVGMTQSQPERAQAHPPDIEDYI